VTSIKYDVCGELCKARNIDIFLSSSVPAEQTRSKQFEMKLVFVEALVVDNISVVFWDIM